MEKQVNEFIHDLIRKEIHKDRGDELYTVKKAYKKLQIIVGENYQNYLRFF